MADQLLIFSHAVEGLFSRGLAGRVTPELRARLREVGVDLDHTLLPAYPRETWARCIQLAAETLLPHEPPEVAWRLLGERMVDGYQETFVGRAMFATLRLLGPRRVLGRTRQNLRSANNYTEVRVADLAPTVVELWLNETHPTLRVFCQGLLLAGMRASGAQDPMVECLLADDTGVTFRATWRGKE
jgi:uncharacterized protein (TIGR02265 family)